MYNKGMGCGVSYLILMHNKGIGCGVSYLILMGCAYLILILSQTHFLEIEHWRSSPFFSRIHVAGSLVLCVDFCISLFGSI